MQDTAGSDGTAILHRIDKIKTKFFTSEPGSIAEYDEAPSLVQELVDACVCFARIVDDFLRISSRYHEVKLISTSLLRTLDECDSFAVTYFHIKRANGFVQLGQHQRVRQWHDTWSRFGLDPSDIIHKLKIELHQFSTYILLSALNRQPNASDGAGLFNPGIDGLVSTRRSRNAHRAAPVLEEDEDVDGKPTPVFQDIWSELVAIRYMHEREMSMASLNPSRPRNVAIIENRLLRAWHDLCIRAGLAEYASSTPVLPRHSSELLNTPRRNFSDIVVTINEPSVHSSFQSLDPYHHTIIDIAMSPHTTLSPVTTAPAITLVSTSTSRPVSIVEPHGSAQLPAAARSSHRLSDHRSIDHHNTFNTPSLDGHSSPVEGRSGVTSYYSSPLYLPGSQSLDYRGTTSLALPSSRFFVASIDLSSRLPSVKLLNWSIFSLSSGSRCLQWEVANSSETLRHYLPSRQQMMPYTAHESMQNSLTVAIFDKCRVEYPAQDYRFDMPISARSSFVDEISRNTFLERLRDKRLIDSFSFDLLWTNQHKRVANYGMALGLSNNERLDIWEDLQYPYRFSMTFFIGSDPIEIAFRDIKEAPHVDSHHIVVIELGPRDVGGGRTPTDGNTKRLLFLPRRRSSASKSPTGPRLCSFYSSDPKNHLANVNVLNVQFSHRSSRSSKQATGPVERRRTSIGSFGSADKAHGTTQEAKRFIEVFKVSYENDLVEHSVPVPQGVVEAPPDNFQPIELPADRDPAELPAAAVEAGHSRRRRI